MRARPVKIVLPEGYVDAPINEATHITLNFPGPVGLLTLPVIRSGTRDGTVCWTWNGDVDKPTLRPSVLTNGFYRMTESEYQTVRSGGKIDRRDYRCHTWVTDGQAQFLDDCNHELRGQAVDMMEVPS